jgi:hypothetical protein
VAPLNPAEDGSIFNGHDLYDLATITAERAVILSPEEGYSPHDVIDDQGTLDNALSSPLAVRFLLDGTLHGCVTALDPDRLGLPRNWYYREHPETPGGSVTNEDLDTADQWLASAINDRLIDRLGATEPGPFEYPTKHFDRRDYDAIAGDYIRASSIMSALVFIAHARHDERA